MTSPIPSSDVAPPLDYAGGTTPTRRSLFLPIYTCIAVGAFVLAAYGVIDLFIPKMENIYRDYGVKLPPATQQLLDVARWGVRWYPANLFPLALLFIFFLLRQPARPPKARSW